MWSLSHVCAFSKQDIVLQMARCSYDSHVEEILGSLVIGRTMIMLHPRGTLDLEYLITVLETKQITCVESVPSLLQNLFTLVEERNRGNGMRYLKSLVAGGTYTFLTYVVMFSHPIFFCVGEALPGKLVNRALSSVAKSCRIGNSYGPTEATISCAFHTVKTMTNAQYIPMGVPFPNYQCLIKDDFSQDVAISQDGELYVGGVGVFAGYLGRDDLTEKVLVEIDGVMFYRTGDLVHLDNDGLLHYVGRKDYQVKLHGQRIELGEIERCLLKTSISACVVLKWEEDHLVAYVQSSTVTEEELRQHCQSHLPPHMVPSVFMILEKLPLNANGKIDRKQLPTPQFSATTRTDHSTLCNLTPLEQSLYDIFRDAFHNESFDVTMPFERIGGTSLDAMRAVYLIRHYIFSKMAPCLLFANPSVRELAQAIEPRLVYDKITSAPDTTPDTTPDTNSILEGNEK